MSVYVHTEHVRYASVLPESRVLSAIDLSATSTAVSPVAEAVPVVGDQLYLPTRAKACTATYKDHPTSTIH